MKSVLVLPVFFCFVHSAPKLRLMPQQLAPPQLLTLPSNATSIRTDISDSFHCDGRDYGYYADVENDCQLFHVCLPVTYADGRNQTFRWSFICPEETVFNQEMFTCTRADEAIDCEESPRFYDLNRNFGSEEILGEVVEVSSTESPHYLEEATPLPEVPQFIGRNLSRRGGKQLEMKKN
ncbi:U-scoloptoxin(01)-Er1a [Leptinotarsa decemlineata]|uniref:U-scoloptoxin(01)-Er1a n=1 Tax=Leptinotarsa decemlineata TaxID=7539 RepID=UPI003D30CCBF